MHLIDRRDVGEQNGLVDALSYHDARENQGNIETVYWNTKGLKVTRFRMLSDRGFPMWDISYCHGILNGQHVDVELPFHQLPKRAWKKTIIDYAKRDKVYAKGLGILDPLVVSTLC